MKTFQQAIRSQDFALSAELYLDSDSDASSITEQGQKLAAAVDAVQVTDNPGEHIHLAPLAASSILLNAGIDPILQMTCRDRNRIALRSDLLGAAALGVSSLLLMRGRKNSTKLGSRAKSVYDWGTRRLIAHANSMRSNSSFSSPVNFLIGSIATAFKPDRDWKPEKMIAKADAGVKFIQTQLCFDIDVLRHYMARLVAEKIIERVNVIVGIAPIPSAEIAQWLGKNLRGAVMPGKVVKRLRQSAAPEQEGIKICAEVLHEAAQIPGVSGANLTSFGYADHIVEAVQTSGVRRRPD